MSLCTVAQIYLLAAGILYSPSLVLRYDKSAYSGRGDRADPSTWPTVSGPVDIVLFEGWMSGFAPASDEEVCTGGQSTQLHVLCVSILSWSPKCSSDGCGQRLLHINC
jgi:hypothetical protein